MNVSGKFCPICKHKNPYAALVCTYCGALLEESLTNIGTTTKNTDEQFNVPTENIRSFIDISLIPEGGIGVYIDGSLKPYYLHIDRELVIGRKTEATSEAFLDLSNLPAFHMGLSRRHAMIRRIESKYEIMDLSSTNGTWLNGERLTPNKPYPFASGSQLRLGHMQLFIMYPTVLTGTNKK